MSDSTIKPGQVAHLTTQDFDQTVNGDTPVFVDFYAEWCGPCQMAAPVIDKLAKDDDYKDSVILAKVNVDEQPELAQKYGVRSIPTVLMFKGSDQPVGQPMVGFPGEPGYRQALDELKTK